MRKIIAITQLTVDGVMQAPGSSEEDRRRGFTHGGWAMPLVDDSLNIVETVAEYDLLLGRTTYDIFAGYWPYQDNEIGKAFGRATKYVVTHRSDQLGWETSVQVSGKDEIRRLKASEGPELHVWGSGQLLQALIAADLVDEYRIAVFPVVVGGGARLFENGVPPRGLTLVETRRTPTGVLVNTYRPAGQLKTA
jgi:dihydrofolate reductase